MASDKIEVLSRSGIEQLLGTLPARFLGRPHHRAAGRPTRNGRGTPRPLEKSAWDQAVRRPLPLPATIR